ncbi:hypothetical protein MIR68_000092 [Amoeboaphelidium protococcarum]|nr:hypothetical protein MIR68_000092 [Amoeboaphelidium protococcarum]
MRVQNNYHFQNWSKTFSCQSKALYQPRSEDELKDVLMIAQRDNAVVKVIGSGHSPSDIACVGDLHAGSDTSPTSSQQSNAQSKYRKSRDILINLDLYDRVLVLNKANSTITVQAGIRLRQLNEYLDSNGLALTNLGSISEQSIAGAISTGTHGTGIDYGILASSVIEMTLIKADCSVITLSLSQNPSIFKAALCGLGCLGIISTVTLKVVPAFNLVISHHTMSFDCMIEQWQVLVNSADHVRFWWFPYTDRVVCWRAMRSNDIDQAQRQSAQKQLQNQSSWMKDKFYGKFVLESLLYCTRFVPSLLPVLNEASFNYQFKQRYDKMEPDSDLKLSMIKRNLSIHKSFQGFNFDCLFPQHVTEWCVEWKSAAPKALVDLKASIDRDPQCKQIQAHFPVEIRFVKGDDIHLSPAYGTEGVCYIGIIVFKPFGVDFVDRKVFWQEYESIMQRYNGRPHWAKQHQLTPSDLNVLYPKFEEFCALRKQMDPDGRFVNNYIQRHLLGTDTKSKL